MISYGLRQAPHQLREPIKASRCLEKIIKRLGDRLQSWPKPAVENLFVDGDTACIQFHGEDGVGKNGANFDMNYCWVMRLHEGRIAHVTGYYDSVKMTALFRD